VNGKQIRLFLVDGTPGGLTTAEITNWTGHVISAQRSDLGETLKRSELSRTGVYMLLGDDTASVGGIACYIGEADVVSKRLKQHQKDGQKDFWDKVVVITSTDANLTKAHGRYLESRLIGLANQAGRATLKNGNAPVLPPLPEGDVSAMEYFIDQLQIVLPVLGVNVIRTKKSPHQSMQPDSSVASPEFHVINAKSHVDARAQQIDGEFVVLSGSCVSAKFGSKHNYEALRQRLIDEGAITIADDRGTVTRDIIFTSPSAAGTVVLGRASNGRKEWVTEDGVTFGQWESRGVE